MLRVVALLVAIHGVAARREHVRHYKGNVTQLPVSDGFWKVNLTIRSFINASMDLVECFAEAGGGTITQQPTDLKPATYRKDIGMWISEKTTLTATGKGLGHAAGRCIFKIAGAGADDPPSPWYTWCLGHDCNDFYTSAPPSSNATGAPAYQPGIGDNKGILSATMTMCVCMPDRDACDQDCLTPDPPPAISG